MSDSVIIQHRFSVEEDKVNHIPRYDSAIVLPLAEYEALSPEDIETRKKELYNGFKDVIKNPPPPSPEPDKEDVIAAIDQQIEDLTQQKEQLLQEDQ